MRSNLDGSGIETLVDTSGGDARPGPDPGKWCVGITVDPKRGQLYCKVSEKGALSVYGLQRMPVTLYVEQWNRLLDFSKLEAGRMKLKIAPVDINNLVKQLVAMLDVEAASAANTVRLYRATLRKSESERYAQTAESTRSADDGKPNG